MAKPKPVPKSSAKSAVPPVDPVYRRGDGFELARADLVQKFEQGRWTLRERAGLAFVNDQREPFLGVEALP